MTINSGGAGVACPTTGIKPLFTIFLFKIVVKLIFWTILVLSVYMHEMPLNLPFETMIITLCSPSPAVLDVLIQHRRVQTTQSNRPLFSQSSLIL